MVEVILRKDVVDLGHAGELVNVRPGYARNYLIPQGLALLATDGNRRRFEEERRQIEPSVEQLRTHLEPLIGELPRIIGADPVYAFPSALLLMTFLSFFIGVFLQLMWEELPITEPL